PMGTSGFTFRGTPTGVPTLTLFPDASRSRRKTYDQPPEASLALRRAEPQPPTSIFGCHRCPSLYVPLIHAFRLVFPVARAPLPDPVGLAGRLDLRPPCPNSLR